MNRRCGGKDGFKALSIDGAAASIESMAAARYPYYREFGVVTPGESQGTAKRLLEFLVGPESQKALAPSGVAIVRK